MKVFVSLASFDPRYRFTTWLYRIASNGAIRAKQPEAEPIKTTEAQAPAASAAAAPAQTAVAAPATTAMSGAAPVVQTGNFDSRWSGFR